MNSHGWGRATMQRQIDNAGSHDWGVFFDHLFQIAFSFTRMDYNFMEHSAKVKGSDVLTPISEIDLRSLTEARDDKDTYLSIYTTTNRDARLFVASRLKAIRRALPKDHEDHFDKALQMAEPALASEPAKGEKGCVIFASAAKGFLQIHRVNVEPEPIVVWDRSPFVLPLARLRRRL